MLTSDLLHNTVGTGVTSGGKGSGNSRMKKVGEPLRGQGKSRGVGGFTFVQGCLTF